MITFGGTRVICSASVDPKPPRWRDAGWVTAEYSMLPGATNERNRRERNGPGGRSQEIQRLIGRSLRAAVDIDNMPGCTITVDCDVLEADGGTRTAAITGGWVALAVAMERLGHSKHLIEQVAAISVGIIDGEPRLDLPYEEDVRAEVDMNVVSLTAGRLVEVQGTAEQAPFDRSSLNALLDLAQSGCDDLFAMQAAAVASARS